MVGGLGALAIGTLLSFPVVEPGEAPQPGLRVVLFDVSAGTTRLRPAHGVWARRQLREEALEASRLGEELAVGTYAAEVRHLGTAAAPEWLERLEGRGGESLAISASGEASLGSELDRAVALYESDLREGERATRSLIVLGEPDFSGPDPASRLARLVNAGVRVQWRRPAHETLMDFAIEALELPRSPAPGEPLSARVTLSLAANGRSRAEVAATHRLEVLLLHETRGKSRDSTVQVAWPLEFAPTGDRRRWSLRVDLGPTPEGFTRVVAEARLVERSSETFGDPIPENDLRSAECRSGERRLVAAVSSSEGLAELRSWIGEDETRWPGLQFSFLEPEELVGRLGHFDLLVTHELGPVQLPEALISQFVKEGGGWFFCGGWGALSGWKAPTSDSSSELSDLLPLVPEPQDAEPRDVIFLVDGSGSMAGEAFRSVQRALARLSLAVSPTDALWLRFFTGSLMEPIDLRVAEEGATATLQRLFAQRVPGGPTAILYSLDQLVAEREQTERPALTFLLTDGRDDVSHDVRARGAAIAAGLSKGESRLIVVAAGEDPDRTLLDCLVPVGERRLEAGDLRDLDELFQREVFRERIREGAIESVLASRGDLVGTQDLLEAWSVAQGWPLHRRYLSCGAREGADVLALSAEYDDPLIAWTRVGAGRVCAWASSTSPEWAPAMAVADDVFGPLWRHLAKSAQAGEPPRLEVRAGELILDRIPRDWPTSIVADFHAQSWGGSPETPVADRALGRTLLWPAASYPGDDPRSRRVADLPDFLGKGTHGRALHVLLRREDSDEVLGQVSLQLPAPLEFESSGSRRVGVENFTGAPARLEGARERVATAAPDASAWIWLVVGLCGVTAAALLGALGSGASGSGPANSPPAHQARRG